MPSLWESISGLKGLLPILRTIALVIALLIFFNIILRIVKRKLLQKVRTKKQISNIEIFSKIFNYVLILVVVIAALFSYSGSWAGLGLTVGLLSAALGWALQKPITGIAAWMMVVIRRPFDIGDRIIIGNIKGDNVKGDVVSITLTHVYIKEVGGIVEGEESSGRITMVPNSILFEQNIINYTLQNEYILDQVTFTVTHKSSIDHAIEIGLKSARKHIGEFIQKIKKEPYVRTFFNPNGISVHVRYFSPAQQLQEFSSKITKEVLDNIKKSKDVKIAYQHNELILHK